MQLRILKNYVTFKSMQYQGAKTSDSQCTIGNNDFE